MLLVDVLMYLVLCKLYYEGIDGGQECFAASSEQSLQGILTLLSTEVADKVPLSNMPSCIPVF